MSLCAWEHGATSVAGPALHEDVQGTASVGQVQQQQLRICAFTRGGSRVRRPLNCSEANKSRGPQTQCLFDPHCHACHSFWSSITSSTSSSNSSSNFCSTCNACFSCGGQGGFEQGTAAQRCRARSGECEPRGDVHSWKRRAGHCSSRKPKSGRLAPDNGVKWQHAVPQRDDRWVVANAWRAGIKPSAE